MGCFPAKISPGHENEKETQNHVKDKNILRGDVTQKYEARKLREIKLRQKQLRITTAAEERNSCDIDSLGMAFELSGRVMEERERLSISSKSRATSRNTSRTGSPSQQRRHVTFNTIAAVTPRSDMTQVTEVTDSSLDDAGHGKAVTNGSVHNS
ncbi:hypothetical protein BaRGS_00034942 [Batillaria attramentaria]|uniref:Uncharacterized protein n=1 Tax=Batillaria attramentaria TaxID=370345 RepID=A0ABD0JGD5_9CAEN